MPAFPARENEDRTASFLAPALRCLICLVGCSPQICIADIKMSSSGAEFDAKKAEAKFLSRLQDEGAVSKQLQKAQANRKLVQVVEKMRGLASQVVSDESIEAASELLDSVVLESANSEGSAIKKGLKAARDALLGADGASPGSASIKESGSSRLVAALPVEYAPTFVHFCRVQLAALAMERELASASSDSATIDREIERLKRDLRLAKAYKVAESQMKATGKQVSLKAVQDAARRALEEGKESKEDDASFAASSGQLPRTMALSVASSFSFIRAAAETHPELCLGPLRVMAAALGDMPMGGMRAEAPEIVE